MHDLVCVAVGALVAVTAGLAAPAIVAGVSAVGSGLASLGGVGAVIGSVLVSGTALLGALARSTDRRAPPIEPPADKRSDLADIGTGTRMR